MKKITCVLAILAAASTAAVAKDLKQDSKTTAPAVTATQMSDVEMDKVTAGAEPMQGLTTACNAPGDQGCPPASPPSFTIPQGTQAGVYSAGLGVSTAPGR